MMKRLFLTLALLAPTLLHAEEKDPLPLGVEVVTGYRSDYEYRGFRLAQDLIDVQAQVEVALSNEWVLNLGGYYGTAAGDGDFSELSGFADLRYDAKQWSAGVTATLHSYDHSFFEDGLDINPSFTWHLTDDLDLNTGLAYDTGAEGWYGNVEASWTHTLNKSSFLAAKLGTSFVEDYYGRSGWNDIYARLGYTYNINRNVSVTPFVGTSIATKSGRDHNDSLYAGVWFEVNF